MMSKEIVELDEQIKALSERQEEAVKSRLYEAYRKSGKTLYFIIDVLEV